MHEEPNGHVEEDAAEDMQIDSPVSVKGAAAVRPKAEEAEAAAAGSGGTAAGGTDQAAAVARPVAAAVDLTEAAGLLEHAAAAAEPYQEAAAATGSLSYGMFANTSELPGWAQPDSYYGFNTAAAQRFLERYPAGYAHYFEQGYGPQQHPEYAEQASAYSAHQSYEYFYQQQQQQVQQPSVPEQPPLPDELPPPLPLEESLVPVYGAAPVAESGAGAAAASAAAMVVKRKSYAAPPVRHVALAEPAAAEAAAVLGSAGGDAQVFSGLPGLGYLQVQEEEAPPLPPEDPAHTLEQRSSSSGVSTERKRPREKSGTGTGSKKVPKSSKMSALVSKWKAVRKDLEEEEEARRREEEEAFEPDAFTKKREKEIAEWQQQQLVSGEASDNPNFVPLAGDWRARLLGGEGGQGATGEDGAADAAAAKTAAEAKAARKAAKKAAKVAAAAAAAAESETKPKYPTNSATRPDLAAISVGLPPGWQAMWDKSSGDIYYGNLATKVIYLGVGAYPVATPTTLTVWYSMSRHGMFQSAPLLRGYNLLVICRCLDEYGMRSKALMHPATSAYREPMYRATETDCVLH